MPDDPSLAHADVPFEEIAGVTISPQTDIPFGKPLQMGLAVYTIYDQAAETGYHAGIRAHLEFIGDHHDCAPVMLDDRQFSQVLTSFAPKGMSEHTEGIWRAAFIAGWVSVFLGLVRAVGETAEE